MDNQKLDLNDIRAIQREVSLLKKKIHDLVMDLGQCFDVITSIVAWRRAYSAYIEKMPSDSVAELDGVVDHAMIAIKKVVLL